MDSFHHFDGFGWIERFPLVIRAQEQFYADRNPTVLIIGGGRCGLDIAARLK